MREIKCFPAVLLYLQLLLSMECLRAPCMRTLRTPTACVSVRCAACELVSAPVVLRAALLQQNWADRVRKGCRVCDSPPWSAAAAAGLGWWIVCSVHCKKGVTACLVCKCWSETVNQCTLDTSGYRKFRKSVYAGCVLELLACHR